MASSELEPDTTEGFDIKMQNASHLIMHHVNALDIHKGVGEFFLTFGLATFPHTEGEFEAAEKAGYLEAQPLFRCGLARETMRQFIGLMAYHYNQQVADYSDSSDSVDPANQELGKDDAL